MERRQTLEEQLIEYSDRGMLPLHMPGHKRKNIWPGADHSLDFTEVEGLDNLHHAEGILLEAMQHASAYYGTKRTFFLVNGSTAGVLAAISTVVKPGETLLMARNSHKSAYHAVSLRQIRPVYLYPDINEEFDIADPVNPDTIERGLEEHPECTAVFITSPTYEGVSSDIRTIAEAVHRAGKILVVDEAHGAHFSRSRMLPKSATHEGADLVIQSLHKTLPALTQTALLHLNGELVDEGKLRYYLGVYQTSSPSYVLMADIDNCITALERNGEKLFEGMYKRQQEFDRSTEPLRHIKLMRAEPSKLVISTKGCKISGPELANRLRERFRIETEMSASTYVIVIFTIADTKESYDRLAEALLMIDTEMDGVRGDVAASNRKDSYSVPFCFSRCSVTTQCLIPAEAQDKEYCEVPFSESVGLISSEFIYLYPPGIPMIVPGEQVTREIVEEAGRAVRAGCLLEGMADITGRSIRVVADI